MAINATNYDGTKDYKIAEVGDVYYPNLLVNGDFQINQRGQASYSEILWQTTYTVDMWYYLNGDGLVVTASDDGIIVDNTSGRKDDCYFGQKLNLSNGTYTASFDVVEKTGNVKFFLGGINASSGQDTVAVGENTFTHAGTPTEYTFVVPIGCKIKLKYCDLFEGSIAYPHVKEDYATALLRCQRYLYKVSASLDSYPIFGSQSGSNLQVAIYLPTQLVSKPTITADSVIVTDLAVPENINNINYWVTSNIPHQIVYVTFGKTDSSIFNVSHRYVANIRAVLSCEPL